MAKHHRHEFHEKAKHMRHEKEHGKFARGGHVSENKDDLKGADDYSGSGEPDVVKEAKDRSDKFKHGGKVHHGKKHKKHFARGGRAGGSPFSSAKIKENTAA